MNDILDLLSSIPYDQRQGGDTLRAIRKIIQAKAVRKQEDSLKFQRESASFNRDSTMPEEIRQVLAEWENPDLKAQAQQQGAPQGPPQAAQPQPGVPQQQSADVGALF